MRGTVTDRDDIDDVVADRMLPAALTAVISAAAAIAVLLCAVVR